MPNNRYASAGDLHGEWAMFLLGFVLALTGPWALDQASPAWQMLGFVAPIWGLGAGLRALVRFVRASQR